MKIIRLLTTSLLIGTLAVMPLDSMGQTNGRRPGSSQNQNSRPGNNRGGQRPGANASRPGANSGGNTSRPSTPSVSRPSTPSTSRPSGPSYNRPGNGNNNHGVNPSRPSAPSAGRPSAPSYNRPSGGNHNHGGNSGWHYRPSTNPSRPAVVPPRPAMRPHLPSRPHYHWTHRPVPPASFRPYYSISPLQAILGVALGTSLNISINTLRGNNYSIEGYNDNCLYLSDVTAMGYRWPDAVLYYSGGVLANSTFSYATSYYDASRYNRLFSTLSSQYGAPVSYNRGNDGISATWWGYDNRYVTLELYQGICQDGYSRYITSLRIGQ